MGVRGLQTFMENNPNVAYQVNIRDIVKNYRRETGRDVIIVVDGSSCLRHFYGTLDWVCGGQIREYVEIFQAFIKAFVDLGCKLVFFFDGPTQSRKRNVWVERRYRSLGDAYKVYDLLNRGIHPSNIREDILMLPPATTYFARLAIQTSSGCEVHTSIIECDEEIAQYARLHNCFAILGQDSDYAIYDGPQYYLSASHLNVQKMTTMNYNRWALARLLRIPPGLLPLLASLVGNDIVRSDDLLNFHKRLCGHKSYGRPSQRDVIFNVASFIKNHTDERNLFNSLPLISRKVFGHEQNVSQLHLSVRSYSINCERASHHPESNDNQHLNPEQSWEYVQKKAEARVRNGTLDTMVYAIMHGLPYESSTALEDFRRTEMPPSADVYSTLRQRIYGIILHDSPGNHEVKEWCMRGENSLAKASSVSVIAPKTGTHPGLIALWDENDTSAETLDKKWTLVAQSVSDKLDPNKLRALPVQLVPPTMLLFIMYNEVVPCFLEKWEVEAFICTNVMLRTLATTTLTSIQLERVVPRAVHLACIFMRGGSIINMLMDACGRPIPRTEVSPYHYFDGKLFQSMYQKAQRGCKILDLLNNQVAQLEEFDMIRSIVLPEE